MCCIIFCEKYSFLLHINSYAENSKKVSNSSASTDSHVSTNVILSSSGPASETREIVATGEGRSSVASCIASVSAETRAPMESRSQRRSNFASYIAPVPAITSNNPRPNLSYRTLNSIPSVMSSKAPYIYHPYSGRRPNYFDHDLQFDDERDWSDTELGAFERYKRSNM